MFLKSLLASVALLSAASAAQATVSVTSASFTYSQDFDSLANTGTANAWANDSTLAGWNLIFPNAAAAAYSTSAGTGTSGGFYSYGAAGSSERALGSLATNANVAVGSNQVMALAMTNNSALTLDSFTLRYDGEQWRNGGNANAQSLTVLYGFGSSFTSVAQWTAAGAGFNFTSPVATASAAAVNGNAAGRVASLGGTVLANWAPGQTLWIRWSDNNDANNDHGLAIDNVSLSVTAVPEPSTYAMLLAGLGAVGFMARRRRA